MHGKQLRPEVQQVSIVEQVLLKQKYLNRFTIDRQFQYPNYQLDIINRIQKALLKLETVASPQG